MMLVSWEVFQQLMHPERKLRKKLKPEKRVARDTFTGEKMTLVSLEEFFDDSSKEKKVRPSDKS